MRLGARFEVWCWSRLRSMDVRVARDSDERRACRTADRRAGYVTDRDRADRVVHVSRGFRKRTGSGRSGGGQSMGAKVTPPWLQDQETDEGVELVGAEGWEDEW